MDRSKAPLAMMEQLAMVLVFAIAAAVCVQVFAYSGKGSARMEQENEVLSAMRIVADAVRAEDAGILSSYGISFVPGNDVSRTFLQDGRKFEEMGLMVQVSYDLSEEYIWYADVTITDRDGHVLGSVRVAGQKGGWHEGE